MQTRITARRFEVADGLRAHIENSVTKLERYYTGIHDAHVVLDGHESPGDAKTAEITVSVSRQQLRAQRSATTHEQAVSNCIRQLRRQVLRYKNRMRSTDQDRHR
jgi:ribosomal subunit interface protein